jgi:RNA polymerase sigma-70 factor, ECF subfamily
VSFALMVVLESLTPAERTAWVLHDLFEMPFTEVAEVVGRSPQAVRQLAARARAHLSDRSPRVEVHAAEHSQTVAAFLKAASGGDLQALLATLDPDVVLTSDGAGEVTAARRPVYGAGRVARFVLGGIAKFTAGQRARVIHVNGAAGLGLFVDDQLVSVLSLTVTGGRITRLDIISAPGKLRRFT